MFVPVDLEYGERPDGMQKPYFVSEAANTAAENGGRAIFEAQSSGRPVPTFKWWVEQMLHHDSGVMLLDIYSM